MNKRMKWLVVFGAAALVGVLAYSSFQQRRYRYEVCVSFHGRNHCATAEGRTEAEAIHSAHEVACALLANGRDENMACLAAEPASARRVSGR